MGTPHKHAELIKAWADGAQIQVKEDNGEWTDVRSPSWNLCTKYRIKPEPVKVFTLNGHVITPMTESPKLDQTVFLPNPLSTGMFIHFKWKNTPEEFMWLDKYLVHETPESAVQHTLAMLDIEVKLED